MEILVIGIDLGQNEMIYKPGCFGGVAEWLKAAVLKTVKCNSFVGSNPTSSANKLIRRSA